ncbi:hypothetical protein [Streptomyces sp. NBC_01497]|uniref:hypothetical protein n=1 Tax=Streptomyces sp. NBC_01497 TaxID=2903885 RepID=UPI002E312C31|nr:hypothetical protein [Streptomyces sp. NBC_01497]
MIDEPAISKIGLAQEIAEVKAKEAATKNADSFLLNTEPDSRIDLEKYYAATFSDAYQSAFRREFSANCPDSLSKVEIKTLARAVNDSPEMTLRALKEAQARPEYQERLTQLSREGQHNFKTAAAASLTVPAAQVQSESLAASTKIPSENSGTRAPSSSKPATSTQSIASPRGTNRVAPRR